MNNKESNFSVYSLEKPTNQTITIDYTPSDNIRTYKYRVNKNGTIGEFVTINNSIPTSIVLDETGIYEIEVISMDRFNNETITKSGVYKIDKEKPVITVSNDRLELTVGGNILVMEDVIVTDNFDGNLINKVTTNYSELDFNVVGLKELTYQVVDEAGNIGSKTIYINVVPNNDFAIYMFQGIILGLIILVYYFLYKITKSARLEKRVNPYSVVSSGNNRKTFFDKCIALNILIINKISKQLKKSNVAVRYSEKYKKYVKIVNGIYNETIDFMSEKILVTIIFLLIAILSKAIQGNILSYMDALVPILVGFITPDVINYIKYRRYREKLENDLLQAITVMNNAFKSGRSILQAIYLVTNELDGPIANEFEKMYVEINFGLNVDTVFQRFAERINLEEVTYLTVSLSILSKTGGNIIKVFSSIEKTLFNKKKLKLELKALTGSSKIIVFVLILLPIFFSALIHLLNPTYFMPFFTNPIGILAFVIMLTLYVTYIYVVRKIIKIRM